MIRRPPSPRLAALLSIVVIAAQLGVIVAFVVDPSEAPRAGSLAAWLWASMHRWSFYPLVGLLVIGIPLTWLGLTVPGPHRQWLVGAWAVWLIVMAILYHNRLLTMLDILWRQVS